jgi:glutamate dehydrogenase (NADP+)
MLKTKKKNFKGMTVAISGSGNVAQYAVQKVNQLGGKVVTLSDSDGTIYDPKGIDNKKWEYVMDLKNVQRGRISEYAKKYKCEFWVGERPWKAKCDVALPCATQNELDKKDAKMLIDNGCIAVAEGANMPTTLEATQLFIKNGVLFGPGKAANAGGVATSGLEMCQNHIGLSWTAEEVDRQLHQIMVNIHKNAYEAAKKYGSPGNYVVGANIAGFLKVADAMMDQGVL